MSTRTLLTALFATALTMPILALAADTPAPAPETPQQPPGAVPSAAPVAPATPPVATLPAATTPATTTAAPVTTDSAAVTVGGATGATAPAVTRDKDTLSVDFPDEDIKTILRNVADLFELNLVVPDTLTGKTSIKLRDVSWRQIFHVVLSPVGYTYVEEGNIIKIVSNELLQQEPGSTEVFIINNAKAADIKPTIDGLIDAATGGKIVIDARSNSLVITERPSCMSRIRTIIDQLDKATDQVMIESKFVEVTDRDIRNIGVNWASLQGLQLGVGNISQSYQKSNQGGIATQNGNSVTYTNTPNVDANGAFANSTINLPTGAVTGLPTTVQGTAGLAGFTPAVAGQPATPAVGIPGTPGYVAAVAGTPDTPASSTAFNTVSNLLTLTGANTTTRLSTAVFSAADFNVIISALKTQNNTKIVSNPTVVTLNNTEAMLNIGQEFPVPSYTYNSERGSFEVSGFTYKPIGIILKVTPQVNSQGIIRMALEPEVSQQNGSTSFGGAGGASIPIIATRKVKTQVSLKDGYTMGLGGLITSSQDHGGTQVPVLGSIPLLGRLFSSKNVNDTSTNLLIFITAKTVNADGASPEEVFDPRSIQAAGMTREELPGIRAAKGADLYAPGTPAKK